MNPQALSPPKRRGPGRPREFDMDAALDAAVLLFRERGYHATSLADVREATGLAHGSIYKAFADKREVFLAAFDRYTGGRHAEVQTLLGAEASGFTKLRALMRWYAEASYGLEGRRGCLVVGSAVELATLDPEIAARVEAALVRQRGLLTDLVRLGRSDGSLPADIDVDASADILLCVLQGFRVVGKTGRTRAQALGAVDQALRLLN